MNPSLNGRSFRSVSNSDGGQVGSETIFNYSEEAGLIWAEYQGGDITRGFLVGVRQADRLDFRYTHVDTAGESAAGHCVSQVVLLPDGRIELREKWEWESRPGRGTSIVREIGAVEK